MFAELAHCLEKAKRAHGTCRGRVLGHVEANADVTLRSEVVDLVRLNAFDEVCETTSVVEVPVD
jgi:hypothetical protein